MPSQRWVQLVLEEKLGHLRPAWGGGGPRFLCYYYYYYHYYSCQSNNLAIKGFEPNIYSSAPFRDDSRSISLSAYRDN